MAHIIALGKDEHLTALLLLALLDLKEIVIIDVIQNRASEENFNITSSLSGNGPKSSNSNRTLYIFNNFKFPFQLLTYHKFDLFSRYCRKIFFNKFKMGHSHVTDNGHIKEFNQ